MKPINSSAATAATDPSRPAADEMERRSAAVTLSDMEVFIFPELMYSLLLANMMSPIIWRWRDDPWFEGITRMKPYRRIQRLKQFIMDHYVFNLDLDTWGLTEKERELARFQPFIDETALAQSNALFGYEGDKYYFDIDIRTHFGLDKYTTNIIPYWKTETVEAMNAFVHRPGYTTGAGECVSLASLYAAALFIVAGISLDDIYLMATPLHSQDFVDIDDGILINNRRLVTKTMWFNGTALSAQARRALENERVTIVAHHSGYIHTLFERATIDPAVYAYFGKTVRAFLRTDLNSELLGNFLRQSPECQRCFVLRWELHGVPHYLPMERAFAYEQSSSYRLTDKTRDKLLADVEQEEFTHTYCPGKMVFNDLEDFINTRRMSLDQPDDVAALKTHMKCACLNTNNAIDALADFCRVEPRLPNASSRAFDRTNPPLDLTPDMDRDAVMARLEALQDQHEFARLAFYAYRDLSRTETRPFLTAALQRSPVCLHESRGMDERGVIEAVQTMPNESIYEGAGRLAQPDEVWNFGRGDGFERLLMLACVLRERRRDAAMTLIVENGRAVLSDAHGAILALPSAKRPSETRWDLSGIALRDDPGDAGGGR